MRLIAIFIVSVASTVIVWRRNAAKRQRREAAWAIVILWAGAALCAAVLLHLPITPPTDWISALLAPVYEPIVAWIKGGDRQ